MAEIQEKQRAIHFSNKPSSYKSSPGFYITGDTYTWQQWLFVKIEMALKTA